jgi:hypothetical protein
VLLPVLGAKTNGLSALPHLLIFVERVCATFERVVPLLSANFSGLKICNEYTFIAHGSFSLALSRSARLTARVGVLRSLLYAAAFT